METAIANSIPLPVLLFSAVAVVLLSDTAPCLAQPVLDANGDPVRVGALYRLEYGGVEFALGGVTTRQPANSTACVSYVGQAEVTDLGLPVLISPGSPFLAPDGILKESVRSRIAFQMTPPDPCIDKGIWTVAEATSSSSGTITAIVTGQQATAPLPRSQWFEVRKADNLERAYKLIYCHVCLACEALCLAELGGYVVGGNVVLGVGNPRFPAPLELPVRFAKYNWNRTAAPVSTSIATS